MKFLSFGSINFHVYPLVSLPLYSYIFLWFFKNSPPLPFMALLINLKPRNKRSYNHGHSKDLALEMAKNHVSSIILNKLDKNSTFSTTLSI